MTQETMKDTSKMKPQEHHKEAAEQHGQAASHHKEASKLHYSQPGHHSSTPFPLVQLPFSISPK
ncbi:MAG: hypothetical protein ACYCQM_00035 [Acidithiobacillus sp.]